MDDKTIAEILKEIRNNASLLSKVLNELRIINRAFPYFINYPQTSVTVATAAKPADPDVIAAGGAAGYDRVVIFHELNRLSPECFVMNDGPGTLFAVATSDGIKWSGESEILLHEFRAFLNVHEIRVRSADATTKYRVSEYEPGFLF